MKSACCRRDCVGQNLSQAPERRAPNCHPNAEWELVRQRRCWAETTAELFREDTTGRYDKDRGVSIERYVIQIRYVRPLKGKV
jgi:hypothetical protein